MIVFEIRSNFFIVLAIRLKTRRSNGFFFFTRQNMHARKIGGFAHPNAPNRVGRVIFQAWWRFIVLKQDLLFGTNPLGITIPNLELIVWSSPQILDISQNHYVFFSITKFLVTWFTKLETWNLEQEIKRRANAKNNETNIVTSKNMILSS